MPQNYLSKRRQFWTLPPVCASKQKRWLQVSPQPSPPDSLTATLQLEHACDPAPPGQFELIGINRPDPRLWVWYNPIPSPHFLALVTLNADLIGGTYAINVSFDTQIQCPAHQVYVTRSQSFILPQTFPTFAVEMKFTFIDTAKRSGRLVCSF